MTTTRTAKPIRRVGVTRFIRNIVDDTKDFVDDVLDRGGEVEHDLRSTVRRTLRESERDHDDHDDHDRDRYRDDQQELAMLREQLGELAEKVSRLSSVET